MLSKIGKVHRGDEQKIIGLLTGDALTDFRQAMTTEAQGAYDKMPTVQRKALNAAIREAAKPVVTDSWKLIMDGSF